MSTSGLALEGHRLGLVVGPLAEADATARVGEIVAVGLGAVQIRLEHRANGGEVLTKLAQRLEHVIGGRVVLHVQSDRGACVGSALADLAGVLQSDLGTVAGQRLPQGAQLEAHLGLAVLGQAGLAERQQQGQVGVAGVLRLVQVESVLAEVVDRAPAAGEIERPRGIDGVNGRVARHKALDDVPAHRGLLDQATHAPALGHLQKPLAQHAACIQHSYLRLPSSSSRPKAIPRRAPSRQRFLFAYWPSGRATSERERTERDGGHREGRHDRHISTDVARCIGPCRERAHGVDGI